MHYSRLVMLWMYVKLNFVRTTHGEVAIMDEWHHWLLIWHKVLVLTITYKWIMDKRDGPTNNVSHMGFILESIRVVGPFVLYLYIIYYIWATRDGLCWLISDKFFCCTKSSYFFSWNGGIEPPFKWTLCTWAAGVAQTVYGLWLWPSILSCNC